jgi:hypothetical protein
MEESMTLKVGDFIGVKCEVLPGPFSEEALVTIETTDGAISGFVRESELRQGASNGKFVGKSGVFLRTR